MSKSIDQRIVEMQFDNEQFESGVKDTLGSLDKLDKALDMEGAGRGLDGLDRTMRNFSFAGIAEGVDTISQKFTTLGIMGITAIQNITNRVIDLGIQLAKSISIDQITAGWTKYEQKTASVRTIMNATGKSIDEVNGYLDELMWFSDETSYGFTDMTTALATMTSAGGDVAKLIPLITGVADATAFAGKGAAEFTRAMYNLNQSYGRQSLQYQDWQSIELAGIASKDLKQAFIDTGKALGTLNKQGKTAKGTLVTIGNFGTTLNEKWANTKVMEAAFSKFSEVTSAAYDLVASGEYDTAAEAIESLAGKYSETAEKAADAAQQAKTFTESIAATKDAASSAWMKTWEVIFGNLEEATVFWTDFTGLLLDMFVAGTNARLELLKAWKNVGGRDVLIEAFWNLVDAIERVVTPIKEAFSDIFPPMTVYKLITLTQSLKAFTERLKIGEETSNNLKRTFAGLFAIISIGVQAISAIAKGVGELIKVLLPGVSGFLGLTASIGDGLVALDKMIKETGIFGTVIETVGKFTGVFIEGIVVAITSLFEILEGFATADLSGISSFTEKIKTRFEPLGKVFEFIEKTFSKSIEILKKISPILSKMATTIGNAITSFQDMLISLIKVGDFEGIVDLFNTGLIAGILLGIKEFIDSLSTVTGGFAGIFDGVRGSLEALQSSLKAKVLMQIAVAIGILAAALLVLSMIDSEKLATALVAITALFVNLFGAMSIFVTFMTGKGVKGVFTATSAMVAMSVAVLILSAALSKLSKLDLEQIGQGLIAIGVMMAMLVKTAQVLSTNTGTFIKGATGFILFGVALNVLATAVAKLGELDIRKLSKGLIGIGVLMAELSIFMKVSDLSGMGVVKNVGILLLASSLVVLSVAVEKLGKIDLAVLGKGLLAIGVILAELAIFVNSTIDAKKVISTAIGLTILGAAMLIFAIAIEKMGNLPIEQLGKGLLGMATALGAIVVALQFMPKNMISNSLGMIGIATALLILSNALVNMGGMTWEAIAKGLVVLGGALTIIAIAMQFMKTALPGAAALLIVAGALSVLAIVLTTLGGMSLGEIGKSLLTLAGAFTVIGLAAIILGPLLPVILGLAGAIALFGVGVLAVGLGVSAFAVGLTALAVAGTAASVALVAIVTSIVSLIPFIAIKLAEGLIEYAKVLGDGAPIIAKAVVDILLAIVKGISETVPVLSEALYIMMEELLKVILDHAPVVMETGGKLFIAFLKGISDNMSGIVKTAVDVVLNFLSGINDKIPEVIDMAFKMVIAFINGLAEAIRTNVPLVAAAIRNLMWSIVDAGIQVLTDSIKEFFGMGENIVKGLIGGLQSMIIAVTKCAGNLGNSIIESAKKALGINSPSSVFKDEVGVMIGRGLADGIKSSTPKAVSAATKMSEAVFNAAKTWMDDRKYYNKLSLEEELYVWETLQKKYKVGTEAYMKLDKEVYRVKNELVKDSFDFSVKYIDEEKYYNRLSLVEELAAWERVQKRYLANSEERKQADREVYRVQQEINGLNESYSLRAEKIQSDANESRKDLEDDYYAKTKEINEKLVQDIQDVNREYEDAVKSRTESLYAAYGLFDKVEVATPTSGDQLIENLQGQVVAFESWKANIDSLAKKGIDEGLLKELTDMGPKSSAQIEALNNMSAEQLTTYVTLWQTKYADARDQAVIELEGMRLDTLTKIAQLNTDSAIALKAYRVTWQQQLTAVNTDAKAQLDVLQIEWDTKLGVLALNATTKIDAMGADIKTSVTETRVATETEFTTLATNIQTIMATPDWYSVGSSIIDGMTKGVIDGSVRLAKAAAAAARAALEAAKQAIGANSPSKEFYKLGMYADQGMALGLTTFSGLVEDSASGIGKSAISSLQTSISNIATLLENQIDTAPVIRPVLDLSNLEVGGKKIANLLGQKRGISLSSVVNKLPVIEQKSIIGETSNQETGQTQKGNVHFVQNNYSPEALSRLDIYRQTKNQLSALKGLVNGA